MKSDQASTGARLPKGVGWLWLVLMFVWMAANSSLALEQVATGALVSAVIAYFCARKTNVWQSIRFSPSGLYHFVAYTGVFFIELVRSNMNMMRYVYSPRIDINPGIVKVAIVLKSPIGRLALANSIALTPGSLVVEIEDGTLFVHWLDVKTTDPDEAARIIAGPFEKHLEKVFG